MNIKANCLGVLTYDEDQIQKFHDVAKASSKETLVMIVTRLCLSHERLRAERDGLQIMFDNMDRKVRHGCTDATCSICDKESK